ncbi:MAG: hypothetical protein QM831_28375 [Kofleriaceae bacterium]
MTKSLMLAVVLSGCSFLHSLAPDPQPQQQPTNPEVGFEKKDAAHGYTYEMSSPTPLAPEPTVEGELSPDLAPEIAAANPAKAKRYRKYKEGLEGYRSERKQDPGNAPRIDIWMADFKIAFVRQEQDKDALDAAGITGDKRRIAREWKLVGIEQDPMDYPKLKQARVAFSLSADGDEWTLHRYSFTGDKLDKETKEGFVTKPGPQHYR